MKRILIVFIVIFCSSLVKASEEDVARMDVITAKEMNTVIKNIIHILDNLYLYPSKAEYVSQTLLTDLNTGRFKTEQNISHFREYIRAALVKATHDTSIDVIEEKPLIRYKEGGVEILNAPNSGVDFEISNDNIGYLNIKGDFSSEETYQLIVDALGLMTVADAIIIDLRLANSASLDLVQTLISYFVPSGTVIGNLVLNNETSDLTSLPITEHEKFESLVPVYIINSAFVSGEWEFFSYSLKSLEKAVVIGQTTMGVGHLTQSIKVGNDIVLKFPYALITKPASNDTWEQIGVMPDYFSTDDESIKKAYDLIMVELSKQ
ncbi:S41 family peptidase [Thalassotalea sp. G2M2-11]|uniref:S41 family peptidase n=1 Tax=Thalassotalea sp. G2M2-11 TaxID=2787627 RepID=UPI0019D16279|nr:S41 family peptidase [Thalassotalea sp. G2M2-11]